MRKPKPATAGEKIVMRWGYTLASTREDAWLRGTAQSIDRAIARAVRKERERCAVLAEAAACYLITLDTMHDRIEGGEP